MPVPRMPNISTARTSPTGKKQCPTCGDPHDVKDFYPNAARKDGREWECRFCTVRRVTECRTRMKVKSRKPREKVTRSDVENFT